MSNEERIHQVSTSQTKKIYPARAAIKGVAQGAQVGTEREECMGDVREALEGTRSRRAVRYAVQRQMFCLDCKGILHTKTALLCTYTKGQKHSLVCETCFRSLVDTLAMYGEGRRELMAKLVDGKGAELDYGSKALQKRTTAWVNEGHIA
jgi:hypothetical protein